MQDKLKRICTLILSFTLLLSFCGCANSAPTWQEQYDLGVKCLSEGNYEDAILAFTAAIEIDPKRGDAYILRGDAYIGVAEGVSASGEELSQEAVEAYKSAVEDYLAAVALEETVDLYKKLAQIYVAVEDNVSAVDVLEKALNLDWDWSLYAYMLELKGGPYDVLVSRKGYSRDGTLEFEMNYTYNEKGYLTQDTVKWYDHDGGFDEYTTTYVYEGEPGHYWYQKDGSLDRYETDEVGFPGKTDNFGGLIGLDTNDVTIICQEDVFTDEDGIVRKSDYYEDAEEGDGEPWDYAIYSYDEQDRAVKITTHAADGTLLGYAVLEWSVVGANN